MRLAPAGTRQSGMDECAVQPVLPAPALAPRRAMLAGGASVLAALAGCAAPEAEPPPVVWRAPPLREPLEPLPPPPMAEGELAGLQADADPVVGGETLDGTLLRRFYARRGFAPVWDAHPAQAEALLAAVMRAGDHGLNPNRFGGALLPGIAQLPPVQRELLLSHAVLSYAEALAVGAIPPPRRRDVEALATEPADVSAALDAALDSRDPVSVIEQLAPGSGAYLALRLALRRLRAGGRADRGLLERQRLLEVNLERQRWLPRRLPPERIWVNITDQSLVLFRDDWPVFSTRVVVGAELEAMQSPEFHSVIDGAFLNPPWIIPEDIVRRSILPRAQQDPAYLASRNITITPDGEAEQAAGPGSGLGAILFDMPNRFDVYIHDTPDRTLFERENRRVSNGCIRVENPLQLAALLMEQPLREVEAKVATGETRQAAVARPVPVFLVYQTAYLSEQRVLEVRPDHYRRDAAVWQLLQGRAARRR